MRGNLRGFVPSRRSVRSIPAYAGEPGVPARRCRAGAVYPRVCGGTRYGYPGQTAERGLSPRMRGNRPHLRRPPVAGRSIPAYAGEPPHRPVRAAAAKVYPRVCGGTDVPQGRLPKAAGLSPRMRGNPHRLPPPERPARSIPAYAGEPSQFSRSTSSMGVYPRVCGGTRFRRRPNHPLPGLSPRMRGNPVPAAAQPSPAGSIPAYAGEPIVTSPPYDSLRVYPRVCGGTAIGGIVAVAKAGLSPRMRGNLPHQNAG